MTDFGAVLRAHRHAADLTQEQLAHTAGVSVEAVRTLENGRRRYPRAQTVELLAKGLGLTPEDLAELTEYARRPTAAGRRSLPERVPDFTGRQEQVDQLRDLLVAGSTGPGVVVISAIAGMGGVGKTALAVHVAHELAAHYPDGVLVVNLRGFGPDEPLPVEDALASLMEQAGAEPSDQPESVDQLAARFRSVLAGRRTLLLLDNAADVAQVKPLLPGSETCAVMVTSRRLLTSLPGSRLLKLDVLGEAEAVALLTETAGADRVSAEPEALRELARLCGYLPLALRITGTHLATDAGLRVAQLAARLSDERARLDQLSSDDLDVRATMALSLARLVEAEPSARAVFTLLGAYRGDVLDLLVAARLVEQAAEEVEEVLEKLVDLHLLETVGPQRYTLHDLVRAYARELAIAELTTAEHDAAQLRILEWYQAVGLRRRLQVFGLGKLARELADPALAEPAAGLDVPQIDDWLQTELPELLAAVRRAVDDAPRAARPVASIAMGLEMYLSDRRRYLDCLALYDAAGTAIRRAGDQVGQSLTFYDWATTLAELGDFEAAAARMREALDAEPTSRHLNHELHCRIYLAAYLGRLGRHEEAFPQAEQGLALAVEFGAEIPIAEAHLVLGTLYGEVQRYAEQDEQFRTAAELVRRTEDVRAARHWILYRIGVAYRQSERSAEAVTYLRECLAVDEEEYDELERMETLQELGRNELALGEAAEAAAHLSAALEVAVRNENLLMEARTRQYLGEALAALGRGAEARAEWERALRLARASGLREAAELDVLLSTVDDPRG
ncbi:NB-ARC domain-containing protein [Kribbella sp. NPDC051770]|uniref:ATP-binding protein n=1 Tax=Kribbella sp. NPDC051770 TaxID=3155413 RepID=UPI00341CC2C2